ncbi:MAG: anaerobic ribonucleoside-triphosphate reductase activating protein [Minisyncoccia bacterium]
MLIGGFQKFTLLDYPGKIAAVVFTTGCNFRCPFCHNPEIVDPLLIDYDKNICEKEILDFLDTRIGQLDGVCITGGEPTLQIGLAGFIRKIKQMGFLIKLDTNASHSSVVKNLIDSGLVDYWAIDIKTSPEKYKVLTSRSDAIFNIEKSINFIVESGGKLELRTTAVPGIVNERDIDSMVNWINKINKNVFANLSRYSIQEFRPEKTLNKDFGEVRSYSKEQLEIMAQKFRKQCNNVIVMSQ